MIIVSEISEWHHVAPPFINPDAHYKKLSYGNIWYIIEYSYSFGLATSNTISTTLSKAELFM